MNPRGWHLSSAREGEALERLTIYHSIIKFNLMAFYRDSVSNGSLAGRMILKCQFIALLHGSLLARLIELLQFIFTARIDWRRFMQIHSGIMGIAQTNRSVRNWIKNF